MVSFVRLLVLSLLNMACLVWAQPLDFSTAFPSYASSNSLISPGTPGSELRYPVKYFAPFDSLSIFDPDGLEGSFLGLLYPQVMEFGEDDFSNPPDRSTYFCYLCRDYAVSGDGLSVTFTLRDDVYWTDGQLITADDVVFSAQLLADPEILPDYRQFVYDGDAQILWRKVDDKTVVMELPRALGEGEWKFKARLTVVPEHIYRPAYEASGVAGVVALYPTTAADIVGAGPWRFGSYSDEEGLRLVQNREGSWVEDAFGNTLPYLDSVRFYAPEVSEGDDLADGEADFASDFPGLGVLERAEAAGVVARELDTGQPFVDHLVPNFTHPDERLGELMRSREFREAVAMLIDRERYAEDLYGARAAPYENFNAVRGYRDLPFEQRGYDPEAAYTLLEGLGLRRDPSQEACPGGCYAWPSGEALELRLVHFDRPQFNLAGEWLESALRAGGLDVTDMPLESEDYVNRMYTRDAESFRDFEFAFESRGGVEGNEFLKDVFSLGADYRWWGVSAEAGQPPAEAQDWEVRLSEIADVLSSDAPQAAKVAASAEGTMLFAQHLPMIPIAEVKRVEAYTPRLKNTMDQVMERYSRVAYFGAPLWALYFED